jgi:hypothetical protein
VITILENKETNFADGVFPNRKEAELYLSTHPCKELELNELQFDDFPFFVIHEINPTEDGFCKPIYVSSQDEVINYVDQVDLKKFTKYYDDPIDDQIFMLDYICESYLPKDEYLINHTHIWKKQVIILKRFITQGQTARAKHHIFNFDGAFEATELGIFWINLSLDSIIDSVTVRTSDIDITNPDHYTFSHSIEWQNREINNLYDSDIIKGNYDDYPYGYVFYENNAYAVKISCPLTYRLRAIIITDFKLPLETCFIYSPGIIKKKTTFKTLEKSENYYKYKMTSIIRRLIKRDFTVHADRWQAGCPIAELILRKIDDCWNDDLADYPYHHSNSTGEALNENAIQEKIKSRGSDMDPYCLEEILYALRWYTSVYWNTDFEKEKLFYKYYFEQNTYVENCEDNCHYNISLIRKAAKRAQKGFELFGRFFIRIWEIEDIIDF